MRCPRNQRLSSGRMLDLRHPTTLIDFEDIAISLSRLCRFAGLVAMFRTFTHS